VTPTFRSCPKCHARCTDAVPECRSCGAFLGPAADSPRPREVIVVHSLLTSTLEAGAEPGGEPGGPRQPRARRAPPEVDDVSRGHVIRSRGSQVLSGELQAVDAPPNDPGSMASAAPDSANTTAEIPRSGGTGGGLALGIVVVIAAVAGGAWYLLQANDHDGAVAAPRRPVAEAPAPAPVVTPVPDPAPAAVVEAPAPAPVPAPDPEITIRFSSTPAGAVVHVIGDDTPLGTTPFEARFPREDRTEQFEFTKRGYVSITEDVMLDVDSALAAALAKPGRKPGKSGRTRPPATTTDPSPLDRDGTIDVFGDESR